MSGIRSKEIGANVWKTPEIEELPGLISRVTRLWAEISEADRDLALQVASMLPTMKIRRVRHVKVDVASLKTEQIVASTRSD
ncbi:hypothetical protein [Neorhizobium sp. T25_27]|uniref:hypothetical protein n=1 Tax=Neorhizobium sp. T25_27 TaxID=2093831 RepID=UPI000CF9D86B|nr:hypothetical protein [Neorhizobium sp. T25_27]